MDGLKYYDVNIQCNSGKAKFIVDAQSKKMISIGSLDDLSGTKRIFVQNLESKFVQLGIFERRALLASIEVKSMFVEEIKAKQSKEGDFKVL